MKTPTDLIRQAQAALKSARAALQDEINSYPRPIAGCDAQFNHLLEQRDKVASALALLTDAPEDHA